MTSKMTIARADDWEGIYVDDNLITEGHRIDVEDGIGIAIRHGASEVETKWVNLNWVHDQGNLPVKMKHVIWENEEYTNNV